MVPSNRVLIVDDDPEIGAFIAEVAKGLGLEAACVSEPDRVLGTYRSFDPGLIVLDLMMPDVDGVQVLQGLADEKCAADIILFSGADSPIVNTAARLGTTHGLRIREVLYKPLAVEALEAALRPPVPVSPALDEDELRAAICAGEITVHFQPKVNLGTRREWFVEGVEALAYWNHAQRGLRAPTEFVPLAEQTELIGELTELVARDALRYAGVLRNQGHVLDVAINLSRHGLADPSLPDRLARRSSEHGLEGSQVIVEVSESAATADDAAAMRCLTRFRLKGMKVSVDDFGTGHSSLVQLHRMPVNELKIDRSFVSDVDANKEARTIVELIVNLAHSLGLWVCAVGVESGKTLEFLRSIGCDLAQGDLICKPLPGEDLLKFLDRVSSDGAASTDPATIRP